MHHRERHTNEVGVTNELKDVLRNLRDYFAGNVTGITRDETIMQNMMRVLFCRVYLEKEKTSEMSPDCSIRNIDSLNTLNDNELKARILTVFNLVKREYPDLFDTNETISLNERNLRHVFSEISRFNLLGLERDAIGDSFEEFIGTSFRGGEGQFFTPRNVVKMMIEFLVPEKGDTIIDPACGSGGFLTQILRYYQLRNEVDHRIIGIDKDLFLAKVANIYLQLLGGKDAKVFCENSLESPTNWHEQTRTSVTLNSFDIVLTNPPFGAKIPVVGSDVLSQFELGAKWIADPPYWNKSNQLLTKPSATSVIY